MVLILAAVAVGALVASVVATRADAAGRVQRAFSGRDSTVCGQLVNNPDAFKAMQALRAEHAKDMQAWYDRYGQDPTSTAAQQALQKLREEHLSEMQSLFKKYGSAAPRVAPSPGNGWGPGAGGSGGYGGGMMGGGMMGGTVL
jgi:hypothetical protein